LFRDLLIGVTSFFRDPEAWKVIEDQVIPRLFAGKNPSSVIRVWTTGCSTGEEAYSLAILLAERQEAMKQSFKVQVFATDIDSQAIATARAGAYPASIAADLSAERLARFFTAEGADGNPTSYRVHKGIRDMMVFSEQNVIKDPPFSKLDLISCRNLLIYMGGDLQKGLVPLFHYALAPGGFLFLGTSETVGEFSDLFSPIDRKTKIYQRKEYFQSTGRQASMLFAPALTAIQVSTPQHAGKAPYAQKRPLRGLLEQALLDQVAPAAALVDGSGDILYLHGRTGMFLEPSSGEARMNIIRMSREGLKENMTTALHRARTGGVAVTVAGISVKTNGGFTPVDLTVSPASRSSTGAGGKAETPLYLVTLEEGFPPVIDSGEQGGPEGGAAAKGAETDADERIAALTKELRAKDEYLQTSTEELETSNEELKSSNEEMQSVNEELQSTNEELETSKEELQSVNEELATVNAELQTKVGDLSRANNDMSNLLAGTGIATVFVDHRLRILRFTPTLTRIINLIISDVGRPVSHIVSNLVGYDSLPEDAQAVLDSLIPRE
ncbi:MAG: CheR family methyltransferase, partial [Spirochaetota bacterium]